MEKGNDPVAPKAFKWHFGLINATLRSQEKQRAAAEPKQLAALVRFAERHGDPSGARPVW